MKPSSMLSIQSTIPVNKEFVVNVDMQGCSMYTQLSKNSCGGCAIYINPKLDHLVRNDLSALEEEYETIWVEINNHKAKKFLFCCLYRHPSSDVSFFLDHLTSVLQKV